MTKSFRGTFTIRRVTTVDEAAIRAEIRSLEPALARSTQALRESAAKLEPYYREMVLRCRSRIP